MNIREFQEDLRNGMTIDAACRKHKTTLAKAFKVLQYKEHNKKKKRKR